MTDEPDPAEDEAGAPAADGDDAVAGRDPASPDERASERAPDEPEGTTSEDSLGPALSVEEAVGELEAVGGSVPAAEALDAGAVRDALADAVEGAEAVARAAEAAGGARPGDEPSVPPDVRAYDRFAKMDRSSYDRVNEFLRDRTYVTAREWAIARLCADFRTATGVEMTKIGEHLPELVPFMTDTYSPQAVNQARSAFEGKVRKSGATFLYGAMSGFFTADELDDVMYEVTEVAKFLLEVEGVDLTVEEELAAEERISSVMREVRRSSEQLRHEGIECPECGHEFHGAVPEAE